MSEHRPTVILQADVHPDVTFLDDPDTYSAVDVARAAWSDISDWVHNGYQPVLTVLMPDGSSHEVDLEETE